MYSRKCDIRSCLPTAAPQIVERLSPDLLSLVVALVAGMAGVISIATAAGRALVGVMMAAALLPPAAIVGIGIAWWEPAVAIQSSVLLAVNILAILKRGGTLFVAILVVSAFLFNVTYADAKRSQLEDAIEENVDALLNAESYANVSLVDVRVEQDQTSLNNRTEKVMITLGRPPGEQHSELHRKIRTTTQQRVGYNLTVEIHVTLVIEG
jgi:uncharacterized membrane protein